ncbi:hypothetical protein GEMRC1_011587 [Eukaryota sp. GEM-RC1]
MTDSKIQELQALEKKHRLAEDKDNTRAVAIELLDVCRSVSDSRALSELTTLVKKRLQQPDTITAIVRHVLSWADDYSESDPSTVPFRQSIFSVVREASAGKLTVEREHAFATKSLSLLLDQQGKISEASSIIKDFAPEQIGALSRSERIDMILFQTSTFLKSDDFVRAEIAFRKITTRSLQHEEVSPELRVRFYSLATSIANIKKELLTAAAAYFDLYISSLTLPSDSSLHSLAEGSLSFAARYCLMSELSPERTTLIGRIMEAVVLKEDLPSEVDLLKTTLGSELINITATDELPESSTTQQFFPNWKLLVKERLIDHNITVIAKFFSRISFDDISSLVQCDVSTMEDRVCTLFGNNVIFCRIDRLKEEISFRKDLDPASEANEWSMSLMSTIDKLEKAVHLIEVEQSFSK